MKLQLPMFLLALTCLLATELQAESITREFAARKGQKLVVDLGIGADISIEGWAEDRIYVKVSSDEADDYDMRFIRNSWGLTIEAEYLRKHGVHKGDIDVEIKVPSAFDLDLKTLGGDIELSDITGTFKGRTLGGELDFENLKGYLEISTMGGDVEVGDSELDGRVRTMGGNVKFVNVRGSLDGKTMGGRVTYHNSDINQDRDDRRRERTRREYRAEVRVDGQGDDAYSDIEARMDRIEERFERRYNEEYDLDEDRGRSRAELRGSVVSINKSAGDIRVPEAPYGAEVQTMGGRIEIDNAQEFVKATTYGGDIYIGEVAGWVNAQTYGGDIEVRIRERLEGRQDIELVSLGGDIELIVPYDFDMNLDLELGYTKNHTQQPKIVSDFPLQIEESRAWESDRGVDKRYLYGRGENGNARHTVRIKTVNGNIYLRGR